MKKIFFVITAIVIIVSNSIGQFVKFWPLQKGEQVPAIPLTMRIGDSSFVSTLSDFKGQVILLDFWSVRCTDCIVAMPKMATFQKEFGDKIKVILVTHNTEEEVKKLWVKFKDNPAARQWIKAGNELIRITGDTILHKLFPFIGVPTHVWINKNQVFEAMAYSSSTNAATIEMLVAGRKPKFDEKIHREMQMDDPLSWVSDDSPIRDDEAMYSFFMPHIEIGQGGSGIVKDITGPGKIKRGVSMVNQSILEMYRYAYQNTLDSFPIIPNSRILIENGDTRRFYFNGSVDEVTNWLQSNTYCYGLKCRVNDSASVLSFMQKDLDRYFQMKSSIEIRKVKCYMLTDSTINETLKTKGGVSKREKKHTENGGYWLYQNVKMKLLANEFLNVIYAQDRFSRFIDGTNYTGNVDITIPSEKLKLSKSIDVLRDFLKPYGLAIHEVYREMPVLVIRNL